MSMWTENLKAGDNVIVSGSCYHQEYQDHVSRVTKTLILVGSPERRFRRRDGCVPAKGYDENYLLEPTQERINTILKNRLSSGLVMFKWKTLPLDILKQVVELTKRGKDPR